MSSGCDRVLSVSPCSQWTPVQCQHGAVPNRVIIRAGGLVKIEMPKRLRTAASRELTYRRRIRSLEASGSLLISQLGKRCRLDIFDGAGVAPQACLEARISLDLCFGSYIRLRRPHGKAFVSDRAEGYL